MRPFFTPIGRWLGVLALAACVATPALAQRTVTLRMNSATMPDTVKAGPEAGVQVRGCLENCDDNDSALPGGETIAWDDRTTLTPTNEGGDYWTVDFQIPDNEKLNFKFYIDQSESDGETGNEDDALPGGWEDGDNHEIAAGTGDVTLDLHYFNKTGDDQAYDWRPFTAAGDSVAVWFRVYLDTEDAGSKGLDLDDGNLVVAVRGDNTTNGSQDGGSSTIDWGSSNIVLDRESSDAGAPGYALFSGRVAYPAASVGTAQAYKFYFSDSDTDNGWEDVSEANANSGGNREFTIPAADSTLHWKFYSDSRANDGSLVTANVTFQVDVSPLSSIGLFQTAEDSVQVRGGFNGWDCPDDNSEDCLLTQTPGTADYVRQVPIAGAPGSESIYKYYLNLNDADGNPIFQNADGTENFDAGYEEPLDFGGGNRPFTFSGNDQELDEAFFNSIRPGNVIGDGEVALTFQADMNAAMMFDDQQGRAFDASKDTVTVQFEDNIWLLTQGFVTGGDGVTTGTNGQLIDGLRLTDPDGDGIYTGTLTVTGPTYNGIGYRLAFGNDTDGLQVEGTGGFDEGRRRYRYITDVNASAFTFGVDTYRPTIGGEGRGPLTNMPWEVNPTGPFSPDDFDYAVPNGYNDQGNAVSTPTAPTGGELALGNVYPNPTTGTARVVVSGRADARVSVRVYDVTGRVVATVAEDVAIDGRPLEFDVSGLASGLYLVRADSESGVATQRLTVVR